MSDYSVDPGATIERLIAERDAALAAEQIAIGVAAHNQLVIKELQQRLTAADEREDALGSLVPEAELALKALNVAVSVHDVELADRARRGLRLIIAALKPAEGRGDA